MSASIVDAIKAFDILLLVLESELKNAPPKRRQALLTVYGLVSDERNRLAAEALSQGGAAYVPIAAIRSAAGELRAIRDRMDDLNTAAGHVDRVLAVLT